MDNEEWLRSELATADKEIARLRGVVNEQSDIIIYQRRKIDQTATKIIEIAKIFNILPE